MSTERFVKWLPEASVQQPCSDISYSREANRENLTKVTMHFGDHQDLLLTFQDVLSLRYCDDLFDLEPPVPINAIPRLEIGSNPGWSFPLLKVENSTWLEWHLRRLPTEDGLHAHFVIISLNSLVQLIALSDVKVEWLLNDR